MQTQPIQIGKPTEYYGIHAVLSDDVAAAILPLQQAMIAACGDAVWNVPRAALHITIVDWLSPISPDKPEYAEYVATLRRRMPEYAEAFAAAILGESPIELTFTVVEAHAPAVIIKATDDGSLARIRRRFADAVPLAPGVRPAPNIIHSTIAKFTQQVELQKVEASLVDQSINVSQTITEFRLVHQSVAFMQKFEVLQTFPLNGGNSTTA